MSSDSVAESVRVLSDSALGVLDSVLLRCGLYAEPNTFLEPTIAANLAFVVERRSELNRVDERIAELRNSPLTG